LTSSTANAKLPLLVTLAPGTSLGPYRIVEPLGAGGMGEVYRARDTRLGRDVALKVLSERLAGRPDALERFEREARTVASLSHPNILALYDFGTHENTVYAVTELLEGESLDRRIGRGVSWRQVVEIGAAIADGLSSAHSRNVVHRDLKPANVFITRDGVVKILDFGLATAAEPEGTETTGPTALTLTKPGTVLGTVGYMSPEQVRGEPADHRSDIFALGCIAAEMLTGKRAFAGNTPNETLAAILRDEPEGLDGSATQIPPNMIAVVRRCLEKDRDRRFQSARDLAFALRALLSGSNPPTDPTPAQTPRPSYRRPIIAGVSVAAVLGTLIVIGPKLADLLHNVFPHSSAVRSLAVLPLANRSGDAAQEYFVDGITDQLIAGLARVDGLRVTSRTSAMTYKEKSKPTREVAQELGVQYVLEGSVTRDASHVTVTTDLVDASTQAVVWSNTYERDVRDVPRLQGEIADQVVRKLSIQLSPEDRAQLHSGQQVDASAFDAYVRGRYYWNKRSPGDLNRAVDEFSRAIDVDPTYAAAYAGLADAYAQIGFQATSRPLDVYPKAKAAANQAAALAPDLAEPHASLGFIHMYFDLDFAASEREYQRAVALNDNLASAHQGYSILLAALLRPDDARREVSRARVLDPLSSAVATDMGFETFYDRRYDEAKVELEDAIKASPKNPLPHYWLARTFQAMKRYDEAIAEYHQADGSFGASASALGGMGHLYGVMGRRDDAAKLLDQLDELNAKGLMTSYQHALVHVALADRENALAWLQRSYEDRANGVVWLLKDPRWDPIRGDPGFEAIVTRVGFPAESRARAPRPLARPL